MTINGNIKFFGKNKMSDADSYSFTSATETLAKYLYDNNLNTNLVSSGSDDVTPEVLIITFATAVTANRACVLIHNIKAGTLQYSDDSQSSWSDFSNAISWSNNTDTNNYYEFTEVSGITDLRLTMNTTQTTDAEKTVAQLRLFSEIATVDKNPSSFDHYYAERSVLHETAKGGNVYVNFSNNGGNFRAKVRFSDANATDMLTFRSLKDRNDSFYIYPGGGDTSHLGVNQEGFRIQDMYFVNYINSFKPSIREVLGIGTDISMEFWEIS